MSRLSDDEKRVFTDRIAELEAELEEYSQPATCNSGHTSLPIKLWDCPTCTEEIKAERDDYRNNYHLAHAKILSREAIIEQLSETELAQDNARLQAELEMVQDALRHALNDDAGWDLHAKAMIEPFNRKTFYQQHKELGRENDRLEEENTLLAEHNRALEADIKRLKEIIQISVEIDDEILTGGDDEDRQE